MAAAAATAVLLVNRGTWFASDDLVHLTEARELGLGRELLGRPVFGHLYPGYQLIYWLLHRAGTLGHPLAVTGTALGLASAGLLAAAVARRWGAPPLSQVAVAAITSLHPAWWPVVVWAAPSANSIPAAIGALGLLWCHTRYLETRSFGWVVAGSASLTLAVACYEASVTVLGTVVLVTAVSWTSGPTGQRLRQLARRWPAWVCYSVPVAGFAAWFVAGPYGNTPAHPPITTAAQSTLRTAVLGLLPGTVGMIPGQPAGYAGVATAASGQGGMTFAGWGPVGTTAQWTILVAAASALALAALARRVGVRSSWVPIALAPALVPRGLAVAAGRFTVLGPGVSVDPHYLADLSWLVPLAVVAVTCTPPGAGTPAIRRGPSATQYLATFCIVATLVVTGIFSFGRVRHRSSTLAAGRYLGTLEREIERIGRSGAPFVVDDTHLPPAFMPAWTGRYSLASVALRARFEHLVVDTSPQGVGHPGVTHYRLTAEGHLVAVVDQERTGDHP